MTSQITRRDALIFGMAGIATVSFGASAFAKEMTTEDMISAFAGDADVMEGTVEIDAPEIAENGNSVPIEVYVDSAMEGDDMVEEILVLAAGNPNPGVATFRFSALSGDARASTRIRLAKTQDVVAVARMKDGSVHRSARSIKVTIGGCGG
jgi:sulfur-oxidizing protein SoxY